MTRSREETVALVKNAFSSVTGIPLKDVSLDKKLSAYQIDSVQLLQLVGELERFVGEIPLGDLVSLKSLQDIVQYIQKRS
jgi:acyl carrier protein